MRTFFILAVCLCVCVCSAGEKEKLAEEYLVAKGTPELLDSTINGMVEKQIQANPALIPCRMAVCIVYTLEIVNIPEDYAVRLCTCFILLENVYHAMTVPKLREPVIMSQEIKLLIFFPELM